MGEPKEELVRSWLIKSRHDLGSAAQLAKEEAAYLDTAIYHCQQAAEKALKAFLVHHDIEVEKSHNLTSLIDRCAEFEPEFNSLTDAAANLTPYATAYRYPNEFFEEPTREQFDEAFSQAKQILESVERLLPKRS